MHECDLCFMKLSTLASLQRHKKNSCKASKGFIHSCNSCNKPFETKASLSRHVCKGRKNKELKVRIKVALKEVETMRLDGLATNFYNSGWSVEELEYILHKIPGSTEELIEEVINEIEVDDVGRAVEDQEDPIDRSDVHWFSNKSKPNYYSDDDNNTNNRNNNNNKDDNNENEDQYECEYQYVEDSSSSDSSVKEKKREPITAVKLYEDTLKVIKMIGRPLPGTDLEKLRKNAEEEIRQKEQTEQKIEQKLEQKVDQQRAEQQRVGKRVEQRVEQRVEKKESTQNRLDDINSDSDSESDESSDKKAEKESRDCMLYHYNNYSNKNAKNNSNKSNDTPLTKKRNDYISKMREETSIMESGVESIIQSDRSSERNYLLGKISKMKDRVKQKNTEKTDDVKKEVKKEVVLEFWETPEYIEDIKEINRSEMDKTYKPKKLLINSNNYTESTNKVYATNLIRSSQKERHYYENQDSQDDEEQIIVVNGTDEIQLIEQTRMLTLNELIEQMVKETEKERIEGKYKEHPPIEIKDTLNITIPPIYEGNYIYCIQALMPNKPLYNVLEYILQNYANACASSTEALIDADFRLIKRLYMNNRKKSEIPFRILDIRRNKYEYLNSDKVWVTDLNGTNLGHTLAHNLIDTYLITNTKLQKITVLVVDPDEKLGLYDEYEFKKGQAHANLLFSSNYQKKLVKKLMEYISSLSDDTIIK